MDRSLFDHEVQVYVSNGSSAHFTIREVYELYLSWQLWVLVMVGFLIMATGHPVTLPQFDSFGLRLGFWFVALFVYLLLSLVYTPFTYRGWYAVFGRPIPLIVLSTPLVLVATYVTSGGLTVLFEPGNPPFSSMTWQMNVRNVLVAHVFETAALMWLLPAQRARKAAATDAREVTLSGRTMSLDRVVRVKAAEHYLEIHTADGVEVLRERLATFLEQVRPEDGIQTHRSHWVARDTAQSLSGSKLTLHDGGKVPVARGRMDDVRAWLDAHADDQKVA
ncbi:LytTR family DNA-binding domain-containing protein [Tateyamaria sp. syn59]|uniref:LytTR family DNA-binding domain-containing protein n=1 Tax=Tateyamaria sp. syn59 TaxID=2576942 RepID=UPI0011BF6ED8|nr:LytTR family DNA-binding domain-containing protein [Tateyamaria sp. syn59]